MVLSIESVERSSENSRETLMKNTAAWACGLILTFAAQWISSLWIISNTRQRTDRLSAAAAYLVAP